MPARGGGSQSRNSPVCLKSCIRTLFVGSVSGVSRLVSRPESHCGATAHPIQHIRRPPRNRAASQPPRRRKRAGFRMTIYSRARHAGSLDDLGEAPEGFGVRHRPSPQPSEPPPSPSPGNSAPKGIQTARACIGWAGAPIGPRPSTLGPRARGHTRRIGAIQVHPFLASTRYTSTAARWSGGNRSMKSPE